MLDVCSRLSPLVFPPQVGGRLVSQLRDFFYPPHEVGGTKGGLKEVNMQAVETENLMNTQSITQPVWMPWFVCFSASLFFFYEFIQMHMFSAINDSLMHAFTLNATQLSVLSDTYLFATTVFLIPAGMVLDRFSTRRIVLTALMICILGTFLFAMSTNVVLAGVCRFFTGIGSAFCFLSCVRLASRWFPPQRMALVTGLIVTMAMIGGAVAQTPMTLLVNHFGWRHALFYDAFFGVAIWSAIYLFVRDFPAGKEKEIHHQQKSMHQLPIKQSFIMAFSKARNWLCGIYTCLMNLPLMILGGTMGTLFLTKVNHIDHTQASYVTMMVFIGTIFGSPFMGWLSDRIGYRKPPMVIGAALSLVVMLVVMFAHNLTLVPLMFLFGLLGFTTAAQVISYPVVIESNPPMLTASCVSAVSLTTLGGAFLLIPVFGRLVDYHWSGAMAGAIRSYSAGDYLFAAWIFPIGIVISLIASLLIKETYCKNPEFDDARN